MPTTPICADGPPGGGLRDPAWSADHDRNGDGKTVAIRLFAAKVDIGPDIAAPRLALNIGQASTRSNSER